MVWGEVSKASAALKALKNPRFLKGPWGAGKGFGGGRPLERRRRRVCLGEALGGSWEGPWEAFGRPLGPRPCAAVPVFFGAAPTA